MAKELEAEGVKTAVLEEDGMAEVKEQEGRVVGGEIVLDSPKDLWDVAGHIALRVNFEGSISAEKVQGLYGWWKSTVVDSLREKYGDEVIERKQQAELASGSEPPTEKQLEYIKTLADKKGKPVDVGSISSKAQASAQIEALLSLTDAAKGTSNFSAQCDKCGGEVNKPPTSKSTLESYITYMKGHPPQGVPAGQVWCWNCRKSNR